MDHSSIHEYDEFIISNRQKINEYLNIVLRYFILTGPAIAIGIQAKIFPYVTYMTCLHISILVLLLSSLHLMLLKRIPHSMAVSMFALTSLDILLFYMYLSDVSIRLTWFLVPLLSMLFCDKRLYYYSVALNFVMLSGTAAFTSFFQAAQIGAYPNGSTALFLNSMGGYTIETLVMLFSGSMILNLASERYKELFRTTSIIENQKKEMSEKAELLDAVVKIYDTVNLIDFVNSTETSFKSQNKDPRYVDLKRQSQSIINQHLQKYIVPSQHEFFMDFTNLQTLRDRLLHKTIISEDFIHTEFGWIRAEYIAVSADNDGFPTAAFYVTRNVDAEKKKEASLLHMSMTDELTTLYNRRRYVKDAEELKQNPLPEDLVIFSMDVNDLKTINDTKGHTVGDELIKDVARCLAASVGTLGTVYRTGGDEFIAIVHTLDPAHIFKTISDTANSWKGVYPDKLNISVGYAAYKDHPEMSFEDLQVLSDEEMYAEKDRYYRENHIDRRRRRRRTE